MKKKEVIDPSQIRHISLDTDGATCSDCARAVEHVGNKLNGVAHIEVDRLNNRIEMDYDGKEDTVQRVVFLVGRLGYTAVPREAV